MSLFANHYDGPHGERPEPPQEWTKTVRLYFVGYDRITALQGRPHLHEDAARMIAQEQQGAEVYWVDVRLKDSDLRHVRPCPY